MMKFQANVIHSAIPAKRVVQDALSFSSVIKIYVSFNNISLFLLSCHLSLPSSHREIYKN